MRAVFFIVALLLLSQFVKAQDTIQRVDGTIQLVRVIETTSSMVRYVPIENPDGPIFSITKQAISKIIFEDGSSVFYSKLINANESPGLTQPERSFSRNIVSLNMYDIGWGVISISYERLSQSGTFGLKIPLSFGLFNPTVIGNELSSSYRNGKIYSTGIGINYYPFKQEPVTWYLGLSVCGGKNNADYPYYSGHSYRNRTVWQAGFHTGFFFRVLRNFELSSQFGISRRSGPAFIQKISIPIEVSICVKL